MVHSAKAQQPNRVDRRYRSLFNLVSPPQICLIARKSKFNRELKLIVQYCSIQACQV
jgi:hypothetical protein